MAAAIEEKEIKGDYIINIKNNLDLIPCSLELAGIEISLVNVMSREIILKSILGNIHDDYDYIIIDCPAGIEQGFQYSIAGADEAIIVTTPEISAVRDADRVIGILEAKEIHNPRIVINRIRPDMVKRGDMMNIDDIIDILAIDLLGIVPDDESIVVSTNKGEPVVMDNKSKAGQAYRNIAKRVTGEEVELLNLEADDEGKLSKIIKLLFGK
jgi:septum site-determining protein MinD